MVTSTSSDAAGVAPTVSLPRLRDQQYKELYTNNTITQVSPFDITIVFQKSGEIAPGQMAIVDQMAVVFSPQHFKALVRSLNETLAGYEAAFGSFTISDADVRAPRSAQEIANLIKAAREAAAKAQTSSSNEQPQPSPQSHGASPKKGKRP